MDIPEFSLQSNWTVSELTRHIRAVLEGDPALQDLWVEGEVSNVGRPASGHIYFTLKDRGASLRCVMWRSVATRQQYQLQDGDAVEVRGSIGVYDAGGAYQLYVDLIRPAGQGALFQEFLRLKDRLEVEGLFDEQRKKALPSWPRRIGIVTSASGAALRDILNTLRRRYPVVEVILAAAAVQGEQAPAELVAGLRALHHLTPRPDVILVGRGGGSIEDLWAFNDERVARAIAEAEIPVISGIGHETDFTIADFVADLRAPTPTAAAELATPDQARLRESLAEYQIRLQANAQMALAASRQAFGAAARQLERSSPATEIRIKRQLLDDQARRLAGQARHQLAYRRLQQHAVSQKLRTLSPGAVLKRGYAIVRTAQGQVVRSIVQVQSGDGLQVRVSDGDFAARVEEDPQTRE
jgi:exodeoxyribonuclease VII large subunit